MTDHDTIVKEEEVVAEGEVVIPADTTATEVEVAPEEVAASTDGVVEEAAPVVTEEATA